MGGSCIHQVKELKLTELLFCHDCFQSAHINDFEGGSATGISFDSMPQVTILYYDKNNFSFSLDQ